MARGCVQIVQSCEVWSGDGWMASRPRSLKTCLSAKSVILVVAAEMVGLDWLWSESRWWSFFEQGGRVL